MRVRPRLSSGFRLARRRRQLAADLAELAGELVELVLDVLEALGEGAQAPLEPLDVARRGQVEGRHRRLLGLERLLAGAEGGGERVLEHLAVDQRLGELADRLLAARPQASWSSSNSLAFIG